MVPCRWGLILGVWCLQRYLLVCCSSCVEYDTCSSGEGADWSRFRQVFHEAVAVELSSPLQAMQVYHELMDGYTLDAALALECRMGSAAVFYRLGLRHLSMGFGQRAANLFQLAMSMFWDVSRAENGLECLQHELWGVRWFDDFMEVYLRHAATLRRNDVAMLPHNSQWQVPVTYRDPSLRIGVFSLCEYELGNPMHWLLSRSRRNRESYCARHDYGMEWTETRASKSRVRHPVWGQIAGPMELLDSGLYDWVLSMDCDSLFVNMDVSLDFVLYKFAGRETPWNSLELDPEVHFLISEDGRGLAGGNWMVRNSPRGREFLREVYGADSGQNPFLKHDLRDQFSLLWHLVRPGVSVPLPPEMRTTTPVRPSSWSEIAYSPGAHLVPQEYLLGSYPLVSCSQPSDSAHRCFEATPRGLDFIVSVPLLGSLPQEVARTMIDRFLLEGLGQLGDEQYERELRALCHHVDISVCLVAGSGVPGS